MLAMDKKAAGQIRLADFTGDPGFMSICSFAQRGGFGVGEQFMYLAPNGLLFDCAALVKQAEQANAAQKGKPGTASMTFVLEYLDMCFIPYSRFDDAAKTLAKKYNASLKDADTPKIDERTAMAALLMVAVGYEQRKLCILRRLCAENNQRILRNGDKESPVWKIVSGEQYALYHIDFVGYRHGKVLQGYQVERSSGYYDLLEYRKESTNLHEFHKADIDRNRHQSNTFLDEFKDTGITLLTYSAQPAQQGGWMRFHTYGPYERVEPLSTT